MTVADIPGLVAIVSGSILLLVSTGIRADSESLARIERTRSRDRWRAALSLFGLVLLLTGLGVRYVESALKTEPCLRPDKPFAEALLHPRCYHGAPWPPKATSR
jgi:hypothetical protein